MSFLAQYQNAVKERAEQNVPPLPLSKEQATQLCELLIKEPSPELVSLLENRVSPGVDDAALVKCEFLDKICIFKNHYLNPEFSHFNENLGHKGLFFIRY